MSIKDQCFNELMNNKGVSRTAPSTPVWIKIHTYFPPFSVSSGGSTPAKDTPNNDDPDKADNDSTSGKTTNIFTSLSTTTNLA